MDINDERYVVGGGSIHLLLQMFGNRIEEIHEIVF